MAADLAELAFQLAREALAEQDKGIDELRARTGTLLAAASFVASFLGGRALDRAGFTWAAILGVVVFSVCALCCIYVLFPRRNVARSLSGPVVYEQFAHDGAPISEAYRNLAYWIQDRYAENGRVVNRLFNGFRAACLALAIDFACWAVALGLH